MLNKVTLGTGRMRIQISRNGLMAKLGVTTGSLDSCCEFWAFEVPSAGNQKRGHKGPIFNFWRRGKSSAELAQAGSQTRCTADRYVLSLAGAGIAE